MDVIRKIRRGANRAAFEADRLVRAGRIRSEIAALEARIDDEQRQMGARVVDLFQAGLLEHPELEPACRRVLQLRAQAHERTFDLNATLAEHAPEDVAPPQTSLP
jgi:hypothetical protein